MLRFVWLCCSALAPFLLLAEDSSSPQPGVRTTLTLRGDNPMSSAAQLRLRLSSKDEPSPYNLEDERFDLLLPKGYRSDQPHGLFIWISPSDTPNLPADWDKVLAKRQLIFVGAHHSGNQRDTFDRIRLAVDANHLLRQRYSIDPRRVYVAGHSGGARVASMLGVAYADMFTGTACFMGVNFYQPTQAADGTVFQVRYLPHPDIAAIARQESRFALVTGSKDFNRDNTLTVFEQGFQAEQFQYVKVFDIPNQGHAMPTANWLDRALAFLDGEK